MKSELEPVLTKAQQQHITPYNFKVIDFSQDFEQNTKSDLYSRNQNPILPKTKALLAKSEKEFNIRQARHEVIRFAIKNQRQTKNKKKQEIQQLIKLGAKMPRRRYRNYKEVLVERKNVNKMREAQKELYQLGKTPTGRASVNCRSKSGGGAKSKVQKAPVTRIDQNYGVVRPKETSKRKGRRNF